MNHMTKLAHSSTANTQSEVKPTTRNLAKLKPLGESINGASIYGNGRGERFAVRTRKYSDVGVFETPAYHVEIVELSGTKPYRVVGTILTDCSALFIQDIKNNGTVVPFIHEEPREERKGYGFLSVMLEEIKKIAIDTGKWIVAIIPENEKLLEHYAQHGFQPDKSSPFGHMRMTINGF